VPKMTFLVSQESLNFRSFSRDLPVDIMFTSRTCRIAGLLELSPNYLKQGGNASNQEHIMKQLIRTAFVISCLFGFASIAHALDKGNTSFVLREGPGMHYAKIGQISSRQVAKVGVCNPSWCHVSVGSRSGWVPTAQINPDLAQLNSNMTRIQSSDQASGGGTVGSSLGKGARLQASTSMTVSMRIVPKAEIREQATKASILPFPVPAHLRGQTRQQN